MNSFVNTILLAFLISVVLLYIPNRSNLPSSIMIPIIAALLVKYIIGDWDKKFQWTITDLYYWTTIIVISYLTVFVFSKK